MSPAQRNLYWREWQRVLKVYPDADRHELHIQTFGEDRSSSDFTNEDLDKVLATFRAISRPADMNGQLRQIQQPMTRAMYALDQVMACLRLYVPEAEAYRDEIIRDRFRRASLGDLRVDQVQALRMTLWARINMRDTGFRATAGHTLHDMYVLAGVACSCRSCSRIRVQQPQPAEVAA